MKTANATLDYPNDTRKTSSDETQRKSEAIARAQQDANTTNASYIVWEHIVRRDTDIPERHRFIILPLVAPDPPGGVWEPVAYVRPR